MIQGTPFASVKYRPLALALIGNWTVVATANATPLLATPLTVTTTFPLVAPEGTGTVILLALQLVGLPTVPLKLTELLPCDAPKLVPVMVTAVPTTPELGFSPEIVGEAATA